MRSRNSEDATARRYSRIVRALCADERVTGPGDDPKARGFGSGALKVGNKIFAMLSSRGEFVVKLPSDRVDALVASGVGERFDAGRGRAMKEWLVVHESAHRQWLPLAREAMLHADSAIGGRAKRGRGER
jgi:hypothetical protein